ncbi:hypothetical protein FPHYL_11270 [Fusarium phyllophilum]|uniref:Uncharacterized protein n=1 Tax=Fusarium phyllophilum TaxID=47803 RepID=A0A8H5IUX4_9HYPO|nr:hypothetical protein FPHYL_11270 [Fusarium phyllophilum]
MLFEFWNPKPFSTRLSKEEDAFLSMRVTVSDVRQSTDSPLTSSTEMSTICHLLAKAPSSTLFIEPGKANVPGFTNEQAINATYEGEKLEIRRRLSDRG